ncbi:MAG TPA: DNA repair protein RecN, partial [Rhodospirillales bacterium]|nr:DNA repair protein RecN [Rhodospirillales bacterium]
MLQALSIRDVVLIERLELSFGSGLGVLTGETGAGKSILLGALGLALGARAEARLVRHGADQAVVSATFQSNDKANGFLEEHGLPIEDDVVILRRVLTSQGKSRAFINDQAVSVGLLKSLGDDLVEIHGQFESQRLLNPANHRGLLDAYGDLADDCARTGKFWHLWRDTVSALQTEQEKLASARRDEEFLRHAVGELDDLAPQSGEDAELAATRKLMM